MDDPRHPRIATPDDVATTLDASSIHVWWLPRRREEGRDPLLRILGGYLSMRPDDMVLAHDAHGRPRLDGALAGRLDFNWSHSGDRAVVAVARKLPVLGIDLEHVRPGRSLLPIARRFFATSEYDLLADLPETRRGVGFVRLWTAKEAVLKAHGRGLAHGLDKVVLTLEHDAPRLAGLEGGLGALPDWHLDHWSLPDQGFATLCWRHGRRRVFHFTPAT